MEIGHMKVHIKLLLSGIYSKHSFKMKKRIKSRQNYYIDKQESVQPRGKRVGGWVNRG